MHCVYFTCTPLLPWLLPLGPAHSTGIPDFRSGMGTVLETGPGVWELRAADMTPQEKAKMKKERQKKRVDLVKVGTHVYGVVEC